MYLSGFLRPLLHVIDEALSLSNPLLGLEQLLLLVHPGQVVLRERLDDGGAVGVAEHVVSGAATVSAIQQCTSM